MAAPLTARPSVSGEAGPRVAEAERLRRIRVVSELVGASVTNERLAPRVLALMRPWLEVAEAGASRAVAGTPLEDLVPARTLALAAVSFYLGANLLTQFEFGEVGEVLDRAAELAPLAGTIGSWTSPPGTSAS